MLHFNCSPTIFYLHQIWHQTCFSSIFNISLLNFLPKHYIIRNIISSESTYSFLQNTNMQKSKYLTSKILLKSSHNQRQLIIITKYNNFEIIVRKGIPSFHPSRIHQIFGTSFSSLTLFLRKTRVIDTISVKRDDLEPRSIAIYSGRDI